MFPEHEARVKKRLRKKVDANAQALRRAIGISN
jgi:hypothetical protein